MRLLGVDDPVFPELLPASRDAMAPSYPEVATGFERISALAYAEEEAFRHTLRAGHDLARHSGARDQGQGGTTISGDQAFQLHDTFGFPIELTLEMAAEQGLSVDEAGFRILMREQRERAQADARRRRSSGSSDVSAYRAVLDGGGATTFTGYEEVVSPGDRRRACSSTAPASRRRVEGDDVEIVLDRTPFYAEGGGQLADQGRLRLDSGAVVDVRDVQTPIPGLTVHRGQVVSGEVVVGDTAVCRGRRRAPPGDQPRSHGDPPRAQGVPHDARRDRDPGRLGERAGAVPLRLLLAHRGAARPCCATWSRRSTRSSPPTCRCGPRS